MYLKLYRKLAFFIQYSRTKKLKYCCHPLFHPPIFCRHSLRLLSPTLPKLMSWILLLPPPLSSDPDNPPKFGKCAFIAISSGIKSFGTLLSPNLLFLCLTTTYIEYVIRHCHKIPPCKRIL